ncbi:MAG: rhodanese-like domain-containing protein [Desulfobacterales bacterium]|nr:rhodanese-like domain-containing protein [Desulfobacterales bacterium]
MRWKQFFTPVQSVDADGARSMLADTQSEEVTILDVRQPSEYERGHIPGAKLIPLPDLPQRLEEIRTDKPAVVY